MAWDPKPLFEVRSFNYEDVELRCDSLLCFNTKRTITQIENELNTYEIDKTMFNFNRGNVSIYVIQGKNFDANTVMHIIENIRKAQYYTRVLLDTPNIEPFREKIVELFHKSVRLEKEYLAILRIQQRFSIK